MNQLAKRCERTTPFEIANRGTANFRQGKNDEAGQFDAIF